MVVIGNGLIAREFSSIESSDDVLIFASGVSNSLENNPKVFLREAELIHAMVSKMRFSHCVYFSTCSVESKDVTPYIQHKLNMEKIIAESFYSYDVFRLPQVVGMTRNSTLVRFLTKQIICGNTIHLQTGALRNIVDVRDIVRIVMQNLNVEGDAKRVRSIVSGKNVKVLHIIEEIGLLLKKVPLIQETNIKFQQHIDTAVLSDLVPTNDPIFKTDYWRDVLRYYVPKLRDDIIMLKKLNNV